MKHKDIIIMTCLVLSIIFLGTGTFAYFRFGSTGNITINAGELMLSINDKSATQNEEFEVTLTNADGSNLKPGDSGSFDLTLNATGSSLDVSIVLEILRTNLPKNLKFYVDEEHTQIFRVQKYDIVKSDSMTKNVTIYWYWEDLEESNDNDFMFKEITATINGTISYYYELPKIYDTLLASARNNLDTNVDFGSESSSTNGIGLMMRDGTQNNEYPIVYYRGDVSNNNVIFADLCWLIVRTTETGGIKLVFNGPVVENADGTESCSNYSGVGGAIRNSNYTDVYAGNTDTAFNTSYNSPVYVGYMYNDTNEFYSSNILDDEGYMAHLLDNNIDQETGRHVQNLKDSTIKGVVDAWYEVNIKGKSEESLLEDTIWCNDRSVISETYSIESMANGTNSQFYFAAYTRLYENRNTTGVTPSLVCNRDMDKFTVESSNGNGDLDYSIGLLTADEINLAGHPYGSSQTTYLTLRSGGDFWSLSPNRFSNVYAYTYVFTLNSDNFNSFYVSYSSGARPSVSLGLGATITGGNGSYQSPYIVG